MREAQGAATEVTLIHSHHEGLHSAWLAISEYCPQAPQTNHAQQLTNSYTTAKPSATLPKEAGAARHLKAFPNRMEPCYYTVGLQIAQTHQSYTSPHQIQQPVGTTLEFVKEYDVDNSVPKDTKVSWWAAEFTLVQSIVSKNSWAPPLCSVASLP